MSSQWKRGLEIAIEEAKKGRGITSPNPPVGAVLMRGEKFLVKGYHKGKGFPHAEREVLNLAERKSIPLQGTTMFVTLEPCCTKGTTNPCTEAIIRSGISEVIYGARDPNPIHTGLCDAIFKKSGIFSICLEEVECLKLILPFTKSFTERKPWVICKFAISLDGRIAFPEEYPRSYLSSKESLHFIHQLRRENDAILIGGETLRRDNPKLTIRHLDYCSMQKKQPWRVVLTKQKKESFDKKLHLFSDKEKQRTLLFHEGIQDCLRELHQRNIHSVLLESGNRIAMRFLEENAIDEYFIFYTPLILGGKHFSLQGNLKSPVPLFSPKYTRVGEDVLLHGYSKIFNNGWHGPRRPK